MTSLSKVELASSLILLLGTLSAAETLRVEVNDNLTGDPVLASVTVVGEEPQVLSARTDENGVAVLKVPSLENVSVTLRTDTHGEKCFGPELTKSGSLKVRLEPSFRIHGVVTDSDGNPLARSTVKIVFSEEDRDCRIKFSRPDEVSNERGEYVLRNVDADRKFTVVFRHDYYLEQQVTRDELLSYGPSATKKQVDVVLTKRP